MAWNRGSQAAVGKTSHGGRGRLIGSVLFAVGVLAVVALACFAVRRTGSDDAAGEKTSAASSSRLLVKRNRPITSPKDSVRAALSTNKVARVRKSRPKKRPELFSDLKGKDRLLAEAVQSAMEANDLQQTLLAAEKALQSDNPDVRLNAVEALGWFGAEALPELTACMADANEDVREAAGHQWEQATQELENPDERFRVVAAAFGTLSGEDMLSSLGGHLSNAATEYIDSDEDEVGTHERRVEVLQALVDVIEGENSRRQNVEAAKEAYNDITGHEWISLDEADAYVKNPENYEEPETAE